jgi:hypothetical protein
MQHDSFYFLHIPKTDGRRFIDLILLDIKDNNPQLKFPAGDLMGNYLGDPFNAHQGWIPGITENTYLFSMMRDPIERAVSYYVFLILQKIKENKNFNNYTKINFTKEGFIKYVEQEKNIQNITSRMFLHDITSNEYRQFFYEKDLDIEDKDLMSMLTERVHRINLLLKSETFNVMDKQDLMRKISKDLGIKELPVSSKKQEFRLTYTEKESSVLYNLLTDLDKDYLRKYFDVDYYIYEKEDLFWKP